ncbi:MAG TPA: sugar ABC transporter permease [Terriglobales bacterium]|nr:sugar ABC transporter permease [Terriglobales bacterium]
MRNQPAAASAPRPRVAPASDVVRRRAAARRRAWLPYLCLLPASLLIGAFVVYPVGTVFYYSLQQYDVTRPYLNGFVGLDNFRQVMTADDVFRASLAVSVKWVGSEVVLQLVLGMALALVLNSAFRGRGLARSLLFSPWAVSGVVVTTMWKLMYNPFTGLLDTVLMRVGVIHSPIQWLADVNTVFASVVAAELWRGVPFFAIVLLAALQAIPPDLYEAAAVDGASRWQAFTRVTLPLLKDAIVLATLLRGVWEFNNVDLIYTMTAGGPGDLTTTLPLYVVNQAIRYHNFGYGSALSVIGFLILLLFAILYLRLGRFGRD